MLWIIIIYYKAIMKYRDGTHKIQDHDFFLRGGRGGKDSGFRYEGASNIKGFLISLLVGTWVFIILYN